MENRVKRGNLRMDSLDKEPFERGDYMSYSAYLANYLCRHCFCSINTAGYLTCCHCGIILYPDQERRII